MEPHDPSDDYPSDTGPSDTGPSDTGHLLHNLLIFGDVLRHLGLGTHPGRMLDVLRALEHVDIGRRQDFYHTLRALLVHRRRDLPLFEEAFRTFWRRPPDRSTTMDLRSLGEQRRYRQPQVGPPPAGRNSSDKADEGGDSETDRIEVTQTYSAREVLRQKDFARFTSEEVSQAKGLMGQMVWDLGSRRTRRWTLGQGRDQQLDLRTTLRHTLRYGGEALDLAHRRRKMRPRPLVLLCDVSGSMERYTRMLLHFIHALTGELERVEAFLFATRLTRVTQQFQYRDIDRAVNEVSQAVPDWSGGTRIGENLKRFNFRWARRVLGWGAVVLVISDGWDTGEPALLAYEMERLQRASYRIVWLNPLLGAEGYQPLAQGMQVAMPFVDDFLPVHNLASLEELAGHLSSLDVRRSGRKQRPRVSLPENIDPDEPGSSIEVKDQLRRPSGPLPTFRHPAWGRGPEDAQGPRA